jgi:hypothetical protein
MLTEQTVDNRRKLNRDDLRIGMHVNKNLLSTVYGVYVFVDSYNNNDFDGEILYFCDDIDSDEATDKITEIENHHGGTCMFYLPKFYGNEDFAVYE